MLTHPRHLFVNPTDYSNLLKALSQSPYSTPPHPRKKDEMPRKPRITIKSLQEQLKLANDQVAALMKEREEAYNASNKRERELYVEKDARATAERRVRENEGQIARLREDTAYLNGKLEECRTILDRLIPLPAKTETTTRTIAPATGITSGLY